MTDTQTIEAEAQAPASKTRKPRKPAPIMVERAKNPDAEPDKIQWLTGNSTFGSTIEAKKAIVDLAEAGLYRIVQIRDQFTVSVETKPVVKID